MDPKSANIPLTAEQRFALGQIVEKGSLVKLGDQTYLMAPVSPMMEDFLKAIRLPDYWNNLDPANQREDKSSVQTPTAITAEERGVPNQGLEWAYGSLLTISHLKDAIDGVGYPGLDLTHIERLGGPECELP